ncbi:FAD-dependent oxidoreductase, partial [Mycobacterium sp. 1423905.2]|uniref:FAD-binding oxidoreductase n=1 Tax=Mycobacterium sp. 1423905.2 TaxID=1856859 RepID=UPI0007FBB846
MQSWDRELSKLQNQIQGPVLTEHSPGYDSEVAVFNMAVQHRPAVVVGAVDADDVSKAVLFAVRHGLNIAILNTGHGPSLAADADTLMITTRRMSGVSIDVGRRSARVEAGVRFGQFVEATAQFGLAPLSGSAPGVGVVGYTLSGGASATMGRKYGWACDHVRDIDVVTADGRLRRVDARTDPDLFGALLGGRSNFGVVTAIEVGLFPVASLYAGAVHYSGDHALQVLEAYRKLTEAAPDELTTGLALLNLPPLPSLPPFMQGKLTVSVRISFVGDAAAGAKLIEPLHRAAPVLADTVGLIPYSQFGVISNDPTDPAPAVEQFGLLKQLTADTVAAIVDAVGPESGSSINIVDIRHLQGAFSRPAPFFNAVGARDAAFAMFGLTV